jgi:hypothetical protein
LPSISVAEQYFSFDSLTARSNLVRVKSAPGNDVLEVDPGENLRLGRGALGFGLDHAVEDWLPRLFQNHHHIERGTCRGSGEHQFHRSRAHISATVFRGPVDHH